MRPLPATGIMLSPTIHEPEAPAPGVTAQPAPDPPRDKKPPPSNRFDVMLARRLHPALAVLALIALSTTGCPEKPVNGPTGPVYGGLNLSVVVPSADYRDTWDQPARDWAAETGASVTIVDGDSTKAPPPGAAVIVSLADLPDLLTKVEPAEIPEPLLSESQLAWNDLLPGLRDHVGVRMRRPMLLPIAAPVLVCGYRQDLLDKAGLAPPATWADYDRLVQTVADWAPGLVAVEPRATDYRATLFAARSLAPALPPGQLGLYFDPETMSPRIAAPPFVQALTELATLTPKLDPRSNEMSPADCLTALSTGQAAIGLCVVTGDGTRRNTDSSQAVALGFSALPGTRSLYDVTTGQWSPADEGGPINRAALVGPGAFVAVVASGPAAEVEASWSLLQKLVVSEQGQLLPVSARSPVRESQLDRVDLFCPASLGGQSARRALAAIAGSLRGSSVCVELPLPDSSEFRKSLAVAVRKTLDGQATAETALTELSQEWTSRLKDAPHADETRRVYRESLGFVGELSITPLGGTGRPTTPE